MPIGDGHTVWILGAGFSRSLGGPLLAELFRQEHYSDLCKVIGPKRALSVTWTQALYKFGQGTHWDNAEDFLVYVEAATAERPDARKAAFLEGIFDRPVYLRDAGYAMASLADYALFRFEPLKHVRHAFATETSEFVRYGNQDEEQWQPYLNWARNLDPKLDSVVTFNYDPIPEMVDRQAAPGLQVLLPQQDIDASRVPVFKLHGSVTWSLDRPDRARVSENAVEKGEDVVICAPGRSKVSLTSTLLKPLWDKARERLSRASAIAIIGYGFPKTDAQARMELLNAIDRETAGSAPLRQVHLVLGPDVSAPPHQRILELVRPRIGRNRAKVIGPIPRGRVVGPGANRIGVVIRHPLYAEDFIGDYQSRTYGSPWEE